MKALQKNKRGVIPVFNLLLFGSILFVVVVVGTAIGGQVLDKVDDNFAVNTQALYIAQNGSGGLLNLASQYPLVGLVFGLSIVLLILITLLFRQVGGGVR